MEAKRDAINEKVVGMEAKQLTSGNVSKLSCSGSKGAAIRTMQG